jgi:hypothetical protein
MTDTAITGPPALDVLKPDPIMWAGCSAYTRPLDFPRLTGHLVATLEIIMINAQAAADTWTGPGDAAILRKRLEQAAAMARQEVNQADLALKAPSGQER